MAYDDTEIEIKIAVTGEKFSEIREKVSSMTISKGSSEQSDRYFTPAHRNFLEPQFPFEWLSVRRRGDKSILTYKHWNPPGAEVCTHCDEFETVVDSPEQIEKILSALNFRELVTVEKTREIFVHKDGFEIAFDTVNGLGHFVEIESLKDMGGIEETRKKLIDFAARIGIPNPVMDKRGYPYQLMKKKGLL